MATYPLAAPATLDNVVVAMNKRTPSPLSKVEVNHVMERRSIANGEYSGEHPRDGLHSGSVITSRDESDYDYHHDVQGDEPVHYKFEDSPRRHQHRPGGGLDGQAIEKREPKHKQQKDAEEESNWRSGTGRVLSPWKMANAASAEKRQAISKRWVNSAKSQGWSADANHELYGAPKQKEDNRHVH